MAMISACTIVKNEAENMPQWLNCVKVFADEIIVVDTGSDDDTAAQAEKAGAKVYFFKWINDFSAAKNYAIEQAKGDWIVFLDADEYFPSAEVEKVRPLIEKYHPHLETAGFFMRMDNVDKNSRMNLGTSFYQLRVFRHVSWLRYEGRIHEYVKNFRETKKVKMLYIPEIVIFHTGYSLGLARKKAQRNLDMILENQKLQGVKPLDNFHLADCYYSLGQWSQAAFYARRAIENHIQPLGQENRPHAVLIQSLMLDKAPTEEIRTAIENAIAEYPNSSEFWMLWGLLDWEMKDKKSAKLHMEKGLEIYEKATKKDAQMLANLSLNLIPAMYLHLGQIYEEAGERYKAADHYLQGLRCRLYDGQLLNALLALLSDRTEAEIIELLNGLYNKERDAVFLVEILKQSPHKKACLYYDRWAKRLSMREKYLLAGRSKEAAASLCEEADRYARLGIVAEEKLSDEDREMLKAVLPVYWQERLQGPNCGGQNIEEILTRLAQYMNR